MTQVITDLRLFRFRCYDDISLKLTDRAVVLTGPNGAGKTNILEALSFLSPGRGLRQAALDDVTQNSAARTHSVQDGIGARSDVYGQYMSDAATKPILNAGCSKGSTWAVSAVLDGQRYGKIRIGTGLDPASIAKGMKKRIVKIDGDARKGQSGLTEYLSVVWVTPQMDRLFLDGSALRRRFLDQVIFNFDGAHLGRLNKYEKALRERSRLLRERGADGADPAWLSSLETVMAEAALAIAAARLITVERLQKAAVENHLHTDIFPLPVIRIEGWVERALENTPALKVEEDFKELLRRGRVRDAVVGGAEYGTHRSDFMVWHKGHNLLADQCSTGEQKGLLMAVTLAHARLVAAERGFPPILLLDEMAAHLDEYRRKTLFEMVFALGGQCWMTGTDKELFAPLKAQAQFLDIENARVINSSSPVTETPDKEKEDENVHRRADLG